MPMRGIMMNANNKVCGFLSMQEAAYGNNDDSSKESPHLQPHHNSNRGRRGCMQQPGEAKVTLLILFTSEENIR